MQIGFHPETFKAKGRESQKQPSEASKFYHKQSE